MMGCPCSCCLFAVRRRHAVCTACCCMLHYFRVLLRSEFIIEAVASAKPLNYPAGQNHRKARSEQGTQVSDSITFPGLGCGGCRASMYQPVASGSAPACRTLRKLARPPGRLLTRIGGAGILDHGQPATAVRARYAETFSFSLSLCYPRANPMLHFSIPIEAALATQPAVLLQSLGQTQARQGRLYAALQGVRAPAQFAVSGCYTKDLSAVPLLTVQGVGPVWIPVSREQGVALLAAGR
jgi:hypothetical protein